MRDEKLKVIRALDPLAPAEVVRGQYRGKDGDDYLTEAGNPDSRTESFVAMKLHVSKLALEGHAVLPTHGQAPARAHVRDCCNLQGTAAFHFWRKQSVAREYAGDPSATGRRHGSARDD